MASITDRVRQLRAVLPSHVELVAAAKTRTCEQVREAIDAGIRIIGHNYVQEAQLMIESLGRNAATWTMIGHLQRNKVSVAVSLFDSIQSVDSLRLAEAIDRECQSIGRVMPILIEVNAASEPHKSGVIPAEAVDLIRKVARLEFVSVQGLMTLGPQVSNPEQLRPYFRETKKLFDRISREQIPDISMSVLSMGMSDSYWVAIEEDATMIRLGTTIFGPRS
ncbi:YggS family pyridoxal phosphate-dependent enzyme [Candidatus Bipolaricaulota bacterium]|nr:YggS family pyridoxal phosphate-dependent enzyme [Candidatus Bipolaricaulota bacterium]